MLYFLIAGLVGLVVHPFQDQEVGVLKGGEHQEVALLRVYPDPGTTVDHQIAQEGVLLA